MTIWTDKRFNTAICFQVEASLEEQAFTEAWGLKAKTVFTDDVLNSLPDPKDKTLMKKITSLGAANLPQAQREEVGFISCGSTCFCHCLVLCKH